MAKYKEYEKNNIYEIYVTDCLKSMAENTAKFCGGNSIKSRYYDIINPAPDNTDESETAEEIIKRMKIKMHKMGGVTDGRF